MIVVLVGVEKTVDFCMLKIWRWWHFILLGNQRFNWMWKGGISTHLIIMYVCSMCNVYGNVIYIFPKFAWLDRFNFVSRLHKTLHIICGIDISLLILISLFFFLFVSFADSEMRDLSVTYYGSTSNSLYTKHSIMSLLALVVIYYVFA